MDERPPPLKRALEEMETDVRLRFGERHVDNLKRWLRERDVFTSIVNVIEKEGELNAERRVQLLNAFESWCFCADDPHYRFYAILHMWYADVVCEQALEQRNATKYITNRRDHLFWQQALEYTFQEKTPIVELGHKIFHARTSLEMQNAELEDEKRRVEERLFPDTTIDFDHEKEEMRVRIKEACLTDMQQREEVKKMRRELLDPTWTRWSLRS